jgi:hypothetical protein
MRASGYLFFMFCFTSGVSFHNPLLCLRALPARSINVSAYLTFGGTVIAVNDAGDSVPGPGIAI